jgi:hypothetical protein
MRSLPVRQASRRIYRRAGANARRIPLHESNLVTSSLQTGITKHLVHGDILLTAVPIGGLRLVDGGAADYKILAVMEEDAAFGNWQDIGDCPRTLIDRLRHYFLTYKTKSGLGSGGRPLYHGSVRQGRSA